MAISFYEASVTNYLQILGGLTGVLDKGLAHFKENNIDPATIVEARLAPDMLPFRFQVHSAVHHSKGALDAIKGGVFRPPSGMPEHSYSELQALVAETIAGLKALSEAEVNALGARDLVFEFRSMAMPFTATGFLFSFSLPNFFFHATTAYDILRANGVKLGKRDYMGALRMKS